MTLVLVILAAGVPWNRRHRRVDMVVQFLGGLVHTDQGFVLTGWLGVDVKDLFHLRDEAGRVPFGDTEPLLTPRLQHAFF